MTQSLSIVFGSLFSVTGPVNHKNLASTSLIGHGTTGTAAASDWQVIVDKRGLVNPCCYFFPGRCGMKQTGPRGIDDMARRFIGAAPVLVRSFFGGGLSSTN